MSKSGCWLQTKLLINLGFGEFSFDGEDIPSLYAGGTILSNVRFVEPFVGCSILLPIPLKL